MKKETCKHCQGLGHVEVCETCNNTGFITDYYLGHNDKIAGFNSRQCDNPKCNIWNSLELENGGNKW